MATPLYRLRCFLRRAQMLLLFLGIAYLMAGSILLLQRSSLTLRTTQPPGSASLSSLMALPAPPTAVRAAPGLGMRARSRWAAPQGVLGGGIGIKMGRHWPTSRHLGVQHLHRRWFHGLMPDAQEQRGPLQSNTRHKGTTYPLQHCLLYCQHRYSLTADCIPDLV